MSLSEWNVWRWSVSSEVTHTQTHTLSVCQSVFLSVLWSLEVQLFPNRAACNIATLKGLFNSKSYYFIYKCLLYLFVSRIPYKPPRNALATTHNTLSTAQQHASDYMGHDNAVVQAMPQILPRTPQKPSQRRNRPMFSNDLKTIQNILTTVQQRVSDYLQHHRKSLAVPQRLPTIPQNAPCNTLAATQNTSVPAQPCLGDLQQYPIDY